MSIQMMQEIFALAGIGAFLVQEFHLFSLYHVACFCMELMHTESGPQYQFSAGSTIQIEQLPSMFSTVTSGELSLLLTLFIYFVDGLVLPTTPASRRFARPSLDALLNDFHRNVSLPAARLQQALENKKRQLLAEGPQVRFAIAPSASTNNGGTPRYEITRMTDNSIEVVIFHGPEAEFYQTELEGMINNHYLMEQMKRRVLRLKSSHEISCMRVETSREAFYSQRPVDVQRAFERQRTQVDVYNQDPVELEQVLREHP